MGQDPTLLEELSLRLGPKTPSGPLGALEVLQLAKLLGFVWFPVGEAFKPCRILSNPVAPLF